MSCARIDDVANSIARYQHGLVTRQQLLGAGITPRVVGRRVYRGWLRPVHRGVYRVGPGAPARAPEMAACLACGSTAVVSHRSAAVLWGMLPPTPPDAAVEVTVLGGRPLRPGISVHRTTRLERSEIARVEGIPITTPARTLLDVAVEASARTIERALAEAFELGRVSPSQVRAILKRHQRLPGSRRLRAVVDNGPPSLTRSEAEERLLHLVTEGSLPKPETNVKLARYEVDFLWRREQLVVEVDGYTFHSCGRAFERDRARDGYLAGLGYRVVRVTWRRLVDKPMEVVVGLTRALEAGRRIASVR